MNYLSPSEYDQYGIETATPEHWVTAASAVIDGYCRRPTLAVSQFTERQRLAPGRASARLTYLPLAPVAPAVTPILSARARFSASAVRRGDQQAYQMAADVVRAFGLPGTWTTLDPAAFECDYETGEVTLPANLLGIDYNEVEITYTAGLASFPDEVKFACAQIVRNAQATPALNVRANRIDAARLDYFADALVDSSVRKLLAPYVAQRLS